MGPAEWAGWWLLQPQILASPAGRLMSPFQQPAHGIPRRTYEPVWAARGSFDKQFMMLFSCVKILVRASTAAEYALIW